MTNQQGEARRIFLRRSSPPLSPVGYAPRTFWLLLSMMAPMVRGAYPTSNMQLAFDRGL